MTVIYVYPTGQLAARRPQAAVPDRGESVELFPADGQRLRYRVACRKWSIPLREEGYMGLIDESDVIVHIWLRPDDGEET